MKILIALLIAVTFTTQALAADKLTLLLDWFINPGHGPIIIAQEKGFFAEQDLSVEIIAPADPADPPKLVAAGKADLAISYQPQLHLQVHEGLPLVRVGTLVATPLNCILVLAEGPIKSIADLAGKKIGYSVAGVEEALLRAILQKNGVAYDSIELINVNWSLSPALMSKQVDAVIGAYRNFELNQMAIEQVPGKCFYIEEEGVPAYDELIYVANSNKMADKAAKDKIARFLAATEKATQFMVNHPLASWEIFSATAKELQDALNKRAWNDTLTRFALRPAAFSAGRYRKMEQFMVDAGLVEKALPIAQLAIDVTAP